jgi:exopolyphosphatase/guanosine-5'-triphosphate,3'-diphosphate pyrophosphatase
MRQAVLDIGTNTVKLLVADVCASPALLITPICEDAITTRVGEGVHESQELRPEAMERTLAVISQFAQRARELGAEKILGFATSAARDAGNGREFLKAAQQRSGITFKILSGDEEAQFAFAGVTSDAAFAGRDIVAIDIGGGSTEICVGGAEGLRAHKSLDMGAVRLTEMFCKSDPMTGCEFAQMSEYIGAALQTLPRELTSVSHDSLVATGGTAMTLAAMELNWNKPPNVQDGAVSELPRVNVDHYQIKNLAGLVNFLRAMPLADRKKIAGLPSARADIIVAGATILLEASRFLGANTVTVSARGIRYGALVVEFARAKRDNLTN